ncbi:MULTISPECIES: flavodoxin-dependent (E)-4-hydroxy-3-methylbut-2-enyl-diphosphate synthase [Bacillota]|uniref:4-hydroxy-3-methylbut-2-en-1-yl diphosphate synthase (flavodoxin) n=2 Tax=Amedibacillus TaxID=2749846 RepID=A0A7G9GME4_9FIRM|nr:MULTISPECIES: flavodoxin-dependent (E)-4-hydroxy-3-methylbut-2-enyl-diphosphate synthase [Bacillota]QNM11976.1 flavodoxin-dependent (E)-4-hydroxy-3-methylbut-2-enyl-diphosphate synthase [[Eubacterium] hominis]MCH4287271.1 flavodoxin-dependent (E)-4-hydroxy-3-methylbut-2-enyl-diphosphate synthase [Amedibacillus hominis]RGB50831.1 flavodoxin-dependent (E)-4-hydroxy-3-methylbut-2-enyl-diphosphate synthase [Absiella sp. AM22-9]RGB56457.1 flavodoxin-dependent (E)-4-hydroxy-3-methylbut-2-enyl-diph
MKRNETREIHVGNLTIGHQNKVVIQSMCNTRTSDVDATVNQILALEKAGCELVRMAIIDEEDAKAITEIKKRTHIPLVADIHYDYRLAISAIEHGIDKIRLNPGNIGAKENVEAVVKVCKEHHIPIRIGINSGSLEKDIHEKYGKPTAEGMMESAKRHVKILEDLDFHDICLSFKSSDPLLCIDAYRLASKTFPYPLHLGVTEAGTFIGSAIKSSMALGTLLNEGIGDTIRISVNGDPVNEITIVKQLLKCCGLLKGVPNLIACPTCGRTAWDMQPVVDEIEKFLQTVNCNVNVAIMGCAVNGPGEAKHADIAIAGGKKEGLLIKKGVIIEKLPQEEIVERLKQEILAFEEEHKND